MEQATERDAGKRPFSLALLLQHAVLLGFYGQSRLVQEQLVSGSGREGRLGAREVGIAAVGLRALRLVCSPLVDHA